MTEKPSAGIEPLFGPPSTWLSVLDDLAAFVDAEEPTETVLIEWFTSRTDVESESIVRRLRWLEAIDLLSRTDGTYRLDEIGLELLETDSPATLSGGLESNVAGFRTVLDALGIRPLTDTEVADLLSETNSPATAGADIAATSLSWLEALGYLERADGLNELTAAGRKRSDGRAGLVYSDGTETEAERAASAADTTTGTETIERGGENGTESADEGDRSPADLTARYDHTCMLCGDRRRCSPTEGFAELHYLLPTEAPHDGPETPENAVVVCPNHRADLEHGLVRIDPRTLTVRHAYEASTSGRTLSLDDDHDLGREYLAYHNDVVARFE